MIYLLINKIKWFNDLTLFPKIYDEYKIKKGDVLLVRGRVEKRLDKYQIVVDKIKVLK